MIFEIRLTIDRKSYQLQVRRTPCNEATEFYLVTYSIWKWLFKTNRPLFISKGLKDRRWNWELLEGKFKYKNNQDEMAEVLEKKLREMAQDLTKEVPVSFEWIGKVYHGTFSRVTGGGTASLWHLYVNKFYWGQLSKSEHFGWKFSDQKGQLCHLSGHFGKMVEQWEIEQL